MRIVGRKIRHSWEDCPHGLGGFMVNDGYIFIDGVLYLEVGCSLAQEDIILRGKTPITDFIIQSIDGGYIDASLANELVVKAAKETGGVLNLDDYGLGFWGVFQQRYQSEILNLQTEDGCESVPLLVRIERDDDDDD